MGVAIGSSLPEMHRQYKKQVESVKNYSVKRLLPKTWRLLLDYDTEYV